MFCESRALSKGEELNSNSLLIDSIMAEDLNLKVGDDVLATINEISVEFEIYGIYSKNTYYTDCNALAIYNSSIDSQNPNWSLQGAFITSSNEESTWSALSSYIPFGRLLSSDEFASSSTYEIYYDNFISSSYINEIERVSEQKTYSLSLYGDLSSSANASILLCTGIIFVIMIMSTAAFVGLSYSNLKHYYAEGNSVLYLKKSMVIGVVEGTINIAAICIICSNSLLGIDMLAKSIMLLVSILIATIINFLMVLIVNIKANNISKKQKTKQEESKSKPDLITAEINESQKKK